MMTRFMGIGVETTADASSVTGIGASKGVVTAIARVIMNLSDADKLGPGEVLVCPSTAPPWTPLFAIAGAVVTDSGGVLSHSAIAAREYAIPAVVGTQVGTQRIPDGSTVTVDGAAGTVRLFGGGE
jgi:pyruvate,water dikinase